jgi:hypothetical protein
VSTAGKISANRANARASTGPTTIQGRARSAKNAHRHGLSLPVFVDPALSQEVEALAREMAGANASSEIQELARRIAEAQIDLRRVRCARHDLLSRALCDPDYDSSAAKRKKSKLAVAAAKLRAKVELNPLPTPLISQLLIDLESSVQSSPKGPQKFATVLSDMTQRLAVMDRYERRALSRRKFAIRAFDAARRQAASARERASHMVSSG